MARSKLVALLPFQPPCPARLAIEVSSLRSFDKELVGVVALCADVRIVGLVTELRFQRTLVSGQVPVLRVNLVPALMKVCRRRLRRECIQAHVPELLGKHSERDCRCLRRTYLQIALGVRVHALQRRISLERRKTVNWSAHKAILERLRERQLVSNKRPRKCSPRSSSADANNAAVPVSQAREDILDRIVVFFIISCFCLDR